MEKRIRSPNYPALSLPVAIERVTALYKNMHTHAGPREVVAKGMGFNTLNGASATAISALHKYGLLEKQGNDVKVSELALRILHPQSAEEKSEAIREAARSPSLFAEIEERFPGRLPNEELLRNYLVRQGFVPAAAQAVVLAYRETSELVNREGGAHDSMVELALEPPMQSPQPPLGALAASMKSVQLQGDVRPLARYDFEGGGYVQAVASANIDTETALQMLETLIQMKRAELKSKPKGHSAGLGAGETTKDSGD